MAENEQLLKVKEVAQMLSCAQITVRHWLREGTLKKVKLARGAVRVRLSEVSKFIAAGEKNGQ